MSVGTISEVRSVRGAGDVACLGRANASIDQVAYTLHNSSISFWHLLVAHPHFCYSRIPPNRNNYYQVSRQRPGLTMVPLESLNFVESNGTILVNTSILVLEKNLLLKIV